MTADLPAKPACFGQEGRLNCECGSSIDCIARKQFWECARTIAGMKAANDRKEHIGLIARTRGKAAADRMYAAYRSLLVAA